MKVFVSIVLLAAAVVAEPPRYIQQDQQQRQYYFARQQQEAAPYQASGWRPDGPAFNLPSRRYDGAQQQSQQQQQYAAPAAPQQQYGAPSASQQQYGAPSASQQQYGAPSAPQQQYGAPNAPQQQYGAPNAPQQQYGAPQREYGTPEESTTTESANAEEEEVSTVQSISEAESEPVNAANELQDEDEQVGEKLPQQTGEYYVALPDGRLQRVRYVSRQDVEAMKYFAKIRAENVEPLRGPIYAYAPLQRLQILPAGLQVAVSPVATAAIPAAADASRPKKLEIEPVAAQVQYQYDNPSSVVPLTAGNTYAAYTADYQAVPAAGDSSRFILSLQ